MTAPRLLLVIPCLNEAEHLPALLDTLCADPAAAAARIVIADGGSDDNSAAIVRERAAADPRIVLLHNPERLQSAGLNLAAAAHGDEADLLIRIDAHARYPADYLSRLLAAYEESGADAVTVSMRSAATPSACFQAAAAAAQNSVLGAGGSPHRKAGGRRWVDHGHHALFRLGAFRKTGGYDESFSHNEDAEFDARLTAQGGRILLAGDIVIDYFPRSDPLALARQYYNHGRGRARTMAKHRLPLKPRQLAPIAVAPAVALIAFAPMTAWAVAPAALWLGVCLIYGCWLGLRRRDLCAAGSGLAAAIMHLAWSAGFLRQQLAGRPAPALSGAGKQTG